MTISARTAGTDDEDRQEPACCDRSSHMIQINAAARLPPRAWGMPFDPRRVFNLEVAAIAVIVLSLAVLAFVGFSIWAEP